MLEKNEIFPETTDHMLAIITASVVVLLKENMMPEGAERLEKVFKNFINDKHVPQGE